MVVKGLGEGEKDEQVEHNNFFEELNYQNYFVWYNKGEYTLLCIC